MNEILVQRFEIIGLFTQYIANRDVRKLLKLFNEATILRSLSYTRSTYNNN
jgi:hypothetical protein